VASRIDPVRPSPEPRRDPGETLAHFHTRRRAWLSRIAGADAMNAPGIPPSSLTADIGSAATKLGEFPLQARGGFPLPTRLAPPAGAEVAPFSQDRGPITEGLALAPAQRSASGAALGASGSTGGFFGPGGAAPAGLRQGVDPAEADLERAFVRATTGYDPAWGVPGDAAGLKWSGPRYLYEPARDQSGLPFQNAADRGFYLQAYQDAALGAGLTGFRWVHTLTAAPTAGRPYSAVGPAESAALWTEVQQYRASMEDNLIGRQVKGEAAFREDPNAPKYVSPYVLPKKQIDIQDYAWIAQKNMPVGCPYPEPYMPVPLKDYTSGYWLSEEYTPSLPLPPPYDQIFWRCSVPSAPGKPHKGKAAPPVVFTSNVSGPGGAGDGGGGGGGGGGVKGWGASLLWDEIANVSIPQPGGNLVLVMPDPPPPPPPTPPPPPPPPPPPLGPAAAARAKKLKKILGKRIAEAAWRYFRYPWKHGWPRKGEGAAGADKSVKRWKRNGSYGLSPHGPLAPAIEEMFNSVSTTRLDCQSAANLVVMQGMLDALREVYRDEAKPDLPDLMFDKMFGLDAKNRAQFWFGLGTQPELEKVSELSTGDFEPGDVVYFSNEHVDIEKYPDYRGENIIVTDSDERHKAPVKGQPNKYLEGVGHPLGKTSVGAVLEKLNSMRTPEAKQAAASGDEKVRALLSASMSAKGHIRISADKVSASAEIAMAKVRAQ